VVCKQPGKQCEVRNFDKKLHGTLPARVALASSYNIPAVKVELAETVPVIVDWYRNLGMRPRIPNGAPDAPSTDYGPSLTLGGYGFTLLEEVTALSAIANMGLYHPTEAILQVTDAKGVPLYQADPSRGSRQAAPAGVAFIIASILSDDNNRAPAFNLNSPLHISDRRSAAKTGTNEDFRSGVTVGFTPDLATGVWIGDTGGKDTPTNIHALTGSNADAVFVAAPLWHKFMVEALKGVPDHWYDPPPDVGKGPGNSWLLKTATKVDHLPGDNPSPKAAPTDYGVPSDPGTGPQRVDNRLPPQCRLPFPAPCTTPPGAPQLSPPPGG
jgi:membrane peptidoglycan carboxypeptidase